jgi:lysophospholipase L1-like esterase
MRLAPLLLAGCLTQLPDPGEDPADTVVDHGDTVQATPTPSATGGLPWSEGQCDGLQTDALHDGQVARWTWQDDLSPPEPGQLVAVGSSSIRRWETATRSLAPWGVVQRGFGGSLLSEVVTYVDSLVLRHRPAGIVLFAGTNDVAILRSADQVVQTYQCLVERLGDDLPHLFFVAITPTPSRWSTQDVSAEVNARVAAFADAHPKLHYVDVETPFLDRGEPPPLELFDPDQLHLSESGYALWSGVIVDAVDAVLPARPDATGGPPSGWIRVDLGPANPEDGAQVTTDDFGNTWNTWHEAARGSEQVLPGEHLGGLRLTDGTVSDVRLIVAGGFRANGRRNGGLTSPDGGNLGTLAVPDATGDFFYVEDADDPGAITLTGLDPSLRYTLRLFGSRADDERRVTEYVVHGAGTWTTTLQTSGAGSGASGGNANDDEVAVLTDLQPDAWGALHLDVRRLEGSFAYLSLLELEVP